MSYKEGKLSFLKKKNNENIEEVEEIEDIEDVEDVEDEEYTEDGFSFDEDEDIEDQTENMEEDMEIDLEDEPKKPSKITEFMKSPKFLPSMLMGVGAAGIIAALTLSSVPGLYASTDVIDSPVENKMAVNKDISTDVIGYDGSYNDIYGSNEGRPEIIGYDKGGREIPSGTKIVSTSSDALPVYAWNADADYEQILGYDLEDGTIYGSLSSRVDIAGYDENGCEVPLGVQIIGYTDDNMAIYGYVVDMDMSNVVGYDSNNNPIYGSKSGRTDIVGYDMYGNEVKNGTKIISNTDDGLPIYDYSAEDAKNNVVSSKGLKSLDGLTVASDSDKSDIDLASITDDELKEFIRSLYGDNLTDEQIKNIVDELRKSSNANGGMLSSESIEEIIRKIAGNSLTDEQIKNLVNKISKGDTKTTTTTTPSDSTKTTTTNKSGNNTSGTGTATTVAGKDGKDGKDGADGRDGIDAVGTTGSQGTQGIAGLDGRAGVNGVNGSSEYTYIRYSATADGSQMTAVPTSATKYMGVCVTTATSAPTDASSYTWSQYKDLSITYETTDGVTTLIIN